VIGSEPQANPLSQIYHPRSQIKLMSQTPPIIGLTTYGRYEQHVTGNGYYDQYYAIPADYVDAVRHAGGVPILLPPGEPSWKRWLDVTDGIVIIGGCDVNPSHYGGDPSHPSLTKLDSERDKTELALAQYLAQEEQQPTLCICRGFQVLNIALGGRLHEHIPDIRERDIHRNEQGFWTIQEINSTPESALAQAMGQSQAHTFSGHHQAVETVAAGLNITAVAPDGIIEALELSDHPWLVAVQWHPEKSAKTDPSQQNLFNTLVQQAKNT